MKPESGKGSRETASRQGTGGESASWEGGRDLEGKIGYTFKNRDLLRQALTHPSFQMEGSAPPPLNNQRLEFLGDSVLNLLLSEKLFTLCPESREGDLSRHRSSLSKGACLSELARTLQLGDHLRLSRGEIETGGRDRDALLEDALEALVGAIYLDGGLDATRTVVLEWYGDLKQRLEEAGKNDNPKGRLQERIQGSGDSEGPDYRLISETGPSHDRRFEVEVLLRGTRLGKGSGSSKKEAESRAAEAALRNWAR